MATPAAKIPMLISSLVDRFHHACRAHPLRKLNTRPRSSSPRNVSTTAPTNDFSISANPASLTLNQNSTGTSAISTAVTSGNPQTVNLTVGRCPSGASCTVSPTSITSGNGSTLTINSGAAAGGTYTVTVTGAGTSNTHSTTVALTVNGPPPPDDFSISANPNSLTVNQGASGNSTISTSVTSGNPQSVTLSSSGCPSGASCTFGTNPIRSGGSSTLTVGAGTAPPGMYTITVTGTGASATHSTTVSLTVPANDFSISASPTSVNVTAGNPGTSTISTVLTSGNAQSITLSASGMPAGTTATFGTNPINSGGSSLLTLATSATTPAGTYTITVTGAGCPLPKLGPEAGRWATVMRAMERNVPRTLLGALRAALRTRTDLTLENLALRQQLAVLRRRSKRPK